MNDSQKPSVPDAVRRAVERTFASTVGTAGVTRERAQELVDDVVRSAEAGGRRAGELRDRLREAVGDLRLATGDDIKSLKVEIRKLSDRVAALERPPRSAGTAGDGKTTDSQE